MTRAADAVALLSDPSLARSIDLVFGPVEPGVFQAASATGSVVWQRDGTVLDSAGTIPVDDHHPYAFESAAQLFDGTHAPDLAVSLRPSHRKYDLGDHGSLDVAHARAPFLAAGPGVVRGGSVDRHLRMVDVAPTLTALLGAPAPSAADGSADHSLLSGDVAESVVVFLLDGANPDALADAMAAGLTPNLAGLVERGVHYTGGVLASFPTATLANHTTALTGAHPGRSGILHNTWHDRAAGATRDLLELQQMFASVEHLLDSVETVHEVVHRHRPDAFTFTTYEYADRGADWSTYRCFRNGEAADDDGAAPDPHMDADWGAQRWYRQMSRVDASSTRQAVRFWNGHNPVPTFGWVTFNLTDKCGHHEGPHSDAVLAAFTETDARIGDVITAIDRAGRLDRTTFVALADHGMALTEGEASLVVTAALGSAGIDAIVCDETFVYLTGK